MTRLMSVMVVVTGLSLLGVGVAQAADPPPPATDPAAAPAAAPAPGAPSEVPPAVPAAPVPEAGPAPVDPLPVGSAAGPPATIVQDQGDGETPRTHLYGVGFRARMVSMPSFMLGLFTKKNVPLFKPLGAFALELFRRGGDFDFVIGLGYQNMSPDDGNWLGKGHDAAIDTDLLQFRSLALYTIDASFIWHNNFTEWFGMHYGAGIGLGIVGGKILRTSNAGCTEANAGSIADCHPLGIDCPNGNCSEAMLKATEGGGVDDVGTPHRFADPDVPGAIPIVNVVVGLDFRIPDVKGWEAKFEVGFFDAFFAGLGVAYAF